MNHQANLRQTRYKCYFGKVFLNKGTFQALLTAAVAQWLRALEPQAEGLVLESQPQHTQVVKTVSDSSTAKRSATAVSVRAPLR